MTKLGSDTVDVADINLLSPVGVSPLAIASELLNVEVSMKPISSQPKPTSLVVTLPVFLASHIVSIVGVCG